MWLSLNYWYLLFLHTEQCNLASSMNRKFIKLALICMSFTGQLCFAMPINVSCLIDKYFGLIVQPSQLNDKILKHEIMKLVYEKRTFFTHIGSDIEALVDLLVSYVKEQHIKRTQLHHNSFPMGIIMSDVATFIDNASKTKLTFDQIKSNLLAMDQRKEAILAHSISDQGWGKIPFDALTLSGHPKVSAIVDLFLQKGVPIWGIELKPLFALLFRDYIRELEALGIKQVLPVHETNAFMSAALALEAFGVSYIPSIGKGIVLNRFKREIDPNMSAFHDIVHVYQGFHWNYRLILHHYRNTVQPKFFSYLDNLSKEESEKLINELWDVHYFFKKRYFLNQLYDSNYTSEFLNQVETVDVQRKRDIGYPELPILFDYITYVSELHAYLLETKASNYVQVENSLLDIHSHIVEMYSETSSAILPLSLQLFEPKASMSLIQQLDEQLR